MKKVIHITGSIVVYKESVDELNKAIQCFIESPLSTRLFLIENYPIQSLAKLLQSPKIIRVRPERNMGFGAGHNLILNEIKSESDFHLILNPDVEFDSSILDKLVMQLSSNEDISMVAPKVFFPNGELQHSCRRYPSLFELILRRVNLLRLTFPNRYRKGVYADLNLDKPFYAEYLTGCFHLYKTKELLRLKGFDERYFLYMEDVDICKKIDESGKKKLYYPLVSINHVLKKGSSKQFSLFVRHFISVLKYFLKWGFK